MAEPVDIRTKKIIPKIEQKFNKSSVLESLERNILSHWDTWGKFQQAWTNRAYKSYRDLDKYIVLIYLIKESWQKLAEKFQYQTMDEFYESEFVTIEKINLIQISNELNIPKETIRRKVNELQLDGILKREGKSIVFNRKGIETQKPEKSIDLLSAFIEKKSKMISPTFFGNMMTVIYKKR